ncbi:Mut7-C RNAse domain-containing protein [Halocatena salina]|uniref:Mut7-C RNAse domain-containing protein n=1 Tax=Halocatena salina TaxID=2934340 RepID=A0A8U0A021_9EURY|nr:Mut7-C RNAse domain-containing protein [Halocatena salina]UPM42412.1 Mut7-C RNAse domain-containing protein [Halocatena salina]
MNQRRLLLDVMCGGLRSYLRMCGHDTSYALDYDVEADDRLIAIARTEDRTLITRDRQLATRTDTAILLESTDTEEQLRTLQNAGIRLTLIEPTRCSRCNGRLEPTSDSRPDDVPEERRVWRCENCGQWFWKGSHWNRVRTTLQSI